MLFKLCKMRVLGMALVLLSGCGVAPSGVAPVVVTPSIPEPSTPLPFTQLSIEPGAVLLTAVGQTQVLRAVGRDAAGKIVSLEGRNLKWYSRNPTKVSISPFNPTLQTLEQNLTTIGSAQGGLDPFKALTPGQTLSNTLQNTGNSAVVVTALTDQGISDITVELLEDAAVRSSDIPVEVHRFRPEVQEIPAPQVLVSPLETGPGGGFSAEEIGAMRDPFPASSAVLRRSGLNVGTLLSFQTSQGGMGRVTEVVQRGEYSLVKLELAGPEKLFTDFDFSRGLGDLSSVKSSTVQVRRVGSSRAGKFTIPIGGVYALECDGKIPEGLDADSLLKSDNFKLDPKFKGIQKNEGDTLLLGGGVELNPSGGFSLGVKDDLKASYKCELLGIPPVPLTVPVPSPWGPIPVPTSINFKPSLSLEVDASKAPKLQVGWKFDDAKVAFQIAVRLENWIPRGILPPIVGELESTKPLDWESYREKLKPNLAIPIGAITGLLPATLNTTIRPLSLNIAWGSLAFTLPSAIPVVGGKGIPQLDVLNADFNLLETKLNWAAPGFVLQQKDSTARFNVSYVNGELALKSNTLTQVLELFPEPLKGPVKNFFDTLGKFLKVDIGQNLGQARFVPLAPSKGYLKINSGAVINLTTDGSQEIQIQPGDVLDLLLEPQAGDPNVKGDLLPVKLAVSNETRYSGLANLAQVWDWTNREDLTKTQHIPFYYAGNTDLRPIRLVGPGPTPDSPPVPEDFRLAGRYTVTYDMCDQIAGKGGVEWRFSADSRLLGVTPVTTANYIGAVKVNCGFNADFSVNGVLMPVDGQEVVIDDCTIPTPFSITFKAQATLKKLSAKLDDTVFLTRDQLPGAQEWLAVGERKLVEGPHTLIAEAQDAGGKTRKLNREFTIKCKEKPVISPPINPPVFTVNGKKLKENEKPTFIYPVCPKDAPHLVNIDVSAYYYPNGSSEINVYTIRGVQLEVNGSGLWNKDYAGIDSVTAEGSTYVSKDAVIKFSGLVYNSLTPKIKPVIKDYEKIVKIVFKDKPDSECKPPPPPPPSPPANPLSCPPSSGPYALALAGSAPCGSSSNSGDPHLVTVDGRYYNFQGVGEFVFARSSVSDMPFEVQARYKPYQNYGSVSITSAVAARVGTDRIAVYANATDQLDVRVNGTKLTVNSSGAQDQDLSDGGKLALRGNIAYVSWKDGSRLTVWSYPGLGGVQNFTLEVHPRHKGQTVGLDGNYNGNPNDDLINRDGTALPSSPSAEQLYKQFGSSWRLSQDESLFDYAPGESTATFTDVDYPPTARVITPAEQVAAEGTCRKAGIKDDNVLQGCVYDVTVTGDANFAKTAALTDSKSDAISISPPSAVMAYGETRTFSALLPAGRSDATLEWTANGGVVTPIAGNTTTVNYTAPQTPGTYTLSARVAGGTLVATSSVKVVASSYGISISPTAVGMKRGATQSFSAILTPLYPGVPDATLEWSANGGVVTPVAGNTTTVNYTAPQTVGTYYLTARVVGTNQGTGIAIGVADLFLTRETRVTLNWGATPSDLDLHLWIPAQFAYHIYSGRRGLNINCFAQLDQESSTGFGPEVMRLKSFYVGDYQLWVQNVTGSSPFVPGNTQVKVTQLDGSELVIAMPPNAVTDAPTGRWWHVFNVTADTGPNGIRLEVINTVGDLVEPYPDAASDCGANNQY